MTIQRNLPLGVEYTLVDSWQTSLEAGITCQNCNAPIANCAELESRGKKFVVGMDCAKTLCGDSLSFMMANAAFSAGKSARARIKKAIKTGEAVSVGGETYQDASNFWKEAGAGRYYWKLKTGGEIWKSFPAHQWEKHVLPMIKDLFTV